MMNNLIIWNNNAYQHTLAACFGAANVIVSLEGLHTALKEINQYDSITVLCELEWTTGARRVAMAELYGISLVKELRILHQLDLPVLFVSFQSLGKILNPEREIITAIGHDFLQLPVLPSSLEAFITEKFTADQMVPKLSMMELNDIQSFYCNREGIIDHELHYLNKFLNAKIDPQNHQEIYDELIAVINRISQLLFVDPAIHTAYFSQLFPTLGTALIMDAITHIRNWADKLKIGADMDKAPAAVQTLGNPFPWKVLLLDDEINEGHDLIKTFRQNHIDIICCDQAMDALNVLKQDWEQENRIMVVISDYRLYENVNGIRRHQKIQGYQFLKEIASSDHLVQLVAFSGLQRKFLLNSFKHYSVRTEVKSKVDYLSHQHTYQIFVNEIIELAEDNWQAIEAMPAMCAGFEKYLKEPYKEFKMHPDYSLMEAGVALRANQLVAEIKQQLSTGQEIRINAIENIKSPLAKAKKDLDIYFKRVRNFLVARRVALWLCANKNLLPVAMDSRKIAELLTDQKYPTDAYRQVLSTNLGLSLDDFPKNITIEERKWLQYDMNLPIFNEVTLIDASFLKIARHFKHFIYGADEIAKEISSRNFVYSIAYKNKTYQLYFDYQFMPLLKTATAVRLAYLMIEDFLKATPQAKRPLVEFVSRIRYELFNTSQKVGYLSKLFRYFNAVYDDFETEKQTDKNPAKELKDKTPLTSNARSSINSIFEKVYQSLLTDAKIDPHAPADFMLLYAIGFEVRHNMGVLEEASKSLFFKKVIEQYNLDFYSNFTSLDDFLLNKKSKNDFEDDDNY